MTEHHEYGAADAPASADAAAEAAAAAERRAAARLLLARPLLTADGPHADGFALVRKHAGPLADTFERFLGYRLTVGPSHARLAKSGLGPGTGRGLERPSGTLFTPRAYAFLALALAVLEGCPEEVLLSRLTGEVHAAADEAGLSAGERAEEQAERRALGAALRRLLDWQVLVPADDGPVPAPDPLLRVDHDLARALVTGPLDAAEDPDDLVRRASAAPDPAVAVRRRLVEGPAVHLDELGPGERALLGARQHEEAHAYRELFGLETEVRAEGVALVDPTGELSDLEFPGTDTLAQAALLLVERLVDALRPHPEELGPTVGVPVPDAFVDGLLGDIADEYGDRAGWRRDYLADRTLFRRDVLGLLHRMGLMAPAGPHRASAADTGDGGLAGARGTAVRGWVLLAAAARYAPELTLHTDRPRGRHARKAPPPTEAPRPAGPPVTAPPPAAVPSAAPVPSAVPVPPAPPVGTAPHPDGPPTLPGRP
ncbi:TIGR02678 family protein [Streptomyces sp. NPDC059506]|uniref:TIGR02678 family protein n=1 Tax=Streptomyces sp. NPDC059506 TaxID=3347751 RepID=UPI0036BD4083